MSVITVAHLKGGVGKTTLSVCIAGELARRNYEVALVDSDPQRSACQWAQLGNLEFPVHEIGLDNVAVGDWTREVRAVSADLLVIDTAPNERLVGASIALADLVLVPCTASGLDIEATERMMGIVAAVRRRRPAPLAVILVPNRVDRRTLEGQQLERELQSFEEVVGPAIGSRSVFVRAFARGQSVADMVPNQIADVEIRSLCDVVLRQLAKAARSPRSPPKAG
jgi:chromosome partitioning protein